MIVRLNVLCAPSRIRTCVDRSREIYSLVHLTALPSTQYRVLYTSISDLQPINRTFVMLRFIYEEKRFGWHMEYRWWIQV